ncbi:MAG: hypothetical protein PVF93_12745, partial [Chromatiaceae bacterium]
ATKRLFLRLVTPSEGVPETRRALPRAEIELDDDAATTSRVVEQLTKARLLSVDDDRIQIAHEALLRTWPRLRGWIEESRDDLRVRQKISHAAAEWAGEQRDEDLLYRGTPLLSALDWQAHNPGQLGPLEREFLDASEAHRAHRDAIAQERQRRTRRWRRAAVVALAILAAGTSLSSLIAYRAANEARANAERAAAATREARERFVTALGSAAFGHVHQDPRLALALAAEAIARASNTPPPMTPGLRSSPPARPSRRVRSSCSAARSRPGIRWRSPCARTAICSPSDRPAVTSTCSTSRRSVDVA